MTRTHTRSGAAALAAAGVLFLLYVLLRPWHDETTSAGAVASFSSSAWVWAHFFAMLGFVLLPLGLLSLVRIVTATRGEVVARAAVVVTWIGSGLTLPYYGAEDFGLHAIGSSAANGVPLDVLGLAEDVRYGGVAATTFTLGLVLVAVGAVLAAVAVARSSVLPSWSGVLFALAFALFLPQFFFGAPVRIGHGVLVLAGCLVLAAVLTHVEGSFPREESDSHSLDVSGTLRP